MDKTISSSNIWKKTITVVVFCIALFGLGWLVYSASGTNIGDINADAIQTAEVVETRFEEAIIITGEIIPNQQNYIDAVESGIVERIAAKDGDDVKKGDTIVQLSNSDLRLEVLQRESQLLEQLNTQRQTRILLNQNDLSQKQQIEEVNYQLDIQKRRFERNQKLFDKGVIAAQDFEEIAKRYKYLKKRQDILQKVYRTDSLARNSQLKQLNNSEIRLTQNLTAVQNILDKLCITASVNGKLSDFNLSLGERVSEGQRIGVIYDINPPKIEAFIDELYINSINDGLQGTLEVDSKQISVVVTKKFPGVEDGDFKVEMAFKNLPDIDFYNGQSVRVRLNLSQPKTALVIPKGRFYSNTGGQWIFIVKGDKAERREIEIGQQNDRYYEVKSGLEEGEKIIISNYDNYMNYNTLNINKS